MEGFKARFLNKGFLIFAGWILAGMTIGLLFIFIFNPFNIKRLYQKPKAWIFSQALHSTLLRQQLLLQESKNGQVGFAEIAKVATASTAVKAEAVKIGSDYLLSTGANGQVSIKIQKGSYKVALITIPEVDFTGVPQTVNIQGDYQLKIGLTKGSGRIKSKAQEGSSSTNDKPWLTVSLFQDKNGDGIKQDFEPSLAWAGVTFRLTPVK